MLPATILAKKRDGHRLSDEEIQYLVDGFVAGAVADYQMAAFAMAVMLRGMTAEETAALTLAMLASGDRLPRAADGPPRVDKHSTGGLGDKVSLLLAPLLACHDVQVPMISGRGLGLTGGTLDKLEAIPGLTTELDERCREQQLQAVGCFIISASERIAPADRRLYALRDVTATVESIPLITASILAKKLAASLDALVMDVKVGGGAFMKTPEAAIQLAQALVQTGAVAGQQVSALLSDMDQPLGHAVGNAIEINETLELLAGGGPQEVRELTLALGAQVLVDVGRYNEGAQATAALEQSLRSGAAHRRFEQLVAAQGGRLTGPLPLAPAHEVVATRAGFVQSLDCETLGRCIVELGGGRRQAGDRIDPRVGISMRVRIGDRIEKGQTLMILHAARDADRCTPLLGAAVGLAEHTVPARPLLLGSLTTAGYAATEAQPAAAQSLRQDAR